jgi:hypothetical protein
MKYHYEVIILGGGCAGVAAAIAAAKNGSKTLLVEQGPCLGGDLLSGLPVDGCLNGRGEWIVGGVTREIFDALKERKGYIGPICDYRALWVVCVDHRLIQFAIMDVLKRYQVDLLLYTFADDVQMRGGTIQKVSAVNKQGRIELTANVFIDCTGDGDIAVKAGSPYEQGNVAIGDLQPVSLVYSLDNVNAKELLAFVREYPDNISVGESDVIRQGRSNEELIEELVKQGYAKVFFVSDGPLMRGAMERGLISEASIIATIPNSIERGTVSINSTRVPVDATDTKALSAVMPVLFRQVDQGIKFLQDNVPGFKNAFFSGIAPRIGIRETRRILGDYILTDEDVLESRKNPAGIAKGGHEYDIHGAGRKHVRKQLQNGGSYDIPYGCIVPQKVENLYIAGRHLSSTRGAHSTARVMGTCMALGEAAGTAAAICVTEQIMPRQMNIERLRELLKANGAILEGTY